MTPALRTSMIGFEVGCFPDFMLENNSNVLEHLKFSKLAVAISENVITSPHIEYK